MSSFCRSQLPSCKITMKSTIFKRAVKKIFNFKLKKKIKLTGSIFYFKKKGVTVFSRN